MNTLFNKVNVWLLSSIVFTLIFTLLTTGTLELYFLFLMYVAPIILICGFIAYMIIEKILVRSHYKILKLSIYAVFGVLFANILYYVAEDFFDVIISTAFEMNLYSVLAALTFGVFSLIFTSNKGELN